MIKTTKHLGKKKMESNLSCGVTTLLCCFDQCCWGCIHSPTSTVLVLK